MRQQTILSDKNIAIKNQSIRLPFEDIFNSYGLTFSHKYRPTQVKKGDIVPCNKNENGKWVLRINIGYGIIDISVSTLWHVVRHYDLYLVSFKNTNDVIFVWR